MRLAEGILKCYECREISDYEEVEIVERDEKRYGVCPHCDMETSIVDGVMTKFSMQSMNGTRATPPPTQPLVESKWKG